MKKTLILFVIITTSLISCKKEEPQPVCSGTIGNEIYTDTDYYNFIGTWNATTVYTSTCQDDATGYTKYLKIIHDSGSWYQMDGNGNIVGQIIMSADAVQIEGVNYDVYKLSANEMILGTSNYVLYRYVK